MAILRGRDLVVALALAFAFAFGCYAPDLRDCTVTCTGPDDCAGDQTCNTAGMCASEGVTCSGSGSNMGMADGGVDAPQMIMLKVQVMGTGKVIVVGIGECDDSECTWQVPRSALRFDAVQTDTDKPFERWTTQNCGGAQVTQPTCTYTPAVSPTTTVGAKFR